MGPHVEGVVAVLLDALHDTRFGEDHAEEAHPVHRLDEGMTGTDLEDAEDLVADPLARNPGEERRVIPDSRQGPRVDREPPFGGKSEGPQEP